MLLAVICLSSFVAALTLLYLLYRHNFSYWLRHKTVPSVPGRIFSGNLYDFITFKTHFAYHLKSIYDDPKYANESVVGIYGLYKPSLLIRDPQLMKSIFIKDFECFGQRFAQPDAKIDPIGHAMLFFARYPLWKDMRSKLTPFFSSAKLKQMYPLIQAVGKNLDEHLKRRGVRFVAEINDISSSFTIDVSTSTIFGVHADSLSNPNETINLEARALLDFSLLRSLNHMCFFFMPKMCRPLRAHIFTKKNYNFIRSTISQAMMDRQRSGLKRNDLIDIFLKLKEESQAVNGNDMSTFMDELYAQAAIFLIGGFETSSSAISHTLLELAKQPEMQEILRAEISKAFVEEKGDISYETICKMEYLDMVVHEVIRLYPFLPFLEREYKRPADRESHYSLKTYNDFELPEGMPVYVSVYAIHYDERYWPNPTKFDPERFSPNNRHNIQPMTYLPFGEGPRNCIGARLGLLQAKTGLAHFLKNHYVQVCDQTTLKAEFDPKAVILQVKGGIYLEVIRDDMYDKLCM